MLLVRAAYTIARAVPLNRDGSRARFSAAAVSQTVPSNNLAAVLRRSAAPAQAIGVRRTSAKSSAKNSAMVETRSASVSPSKAARNGVTRTQALKAAADSAVPEFRVLIAHCGTFDRIPTLNTIGDQNKGKAFAASDRTHQVSHSGPKSFCESNLTNKNSLIACTPRFLSPACLDPHLKRLFLFIFTSVLIAINCRVLSCFDASALALL